MQWRQGLWERKTVYPGRLSADLLPADECRWVLTLSTLLCPGRVQCMTWSDLAQLCGHPEKQTRIPEVFMIITVSEDTCLVQPLFTCPGHTSVTQLQMIKVAGKRWIVSRTEVGQPCGRTHSENSLGGGDILVVEVLFFCPSLWSASRAASVF